MNVVVKYCGAYADHGGYGEANRNAIMSLHLSGANVIVQKAAFTLKSPPGKDYRIETADSLSKKDTTSYNIKILHVTPDNYKLYMEKGKYHIGHLFWETDRLPTSWVAPCNAMNEIWTDSPRTAEAIKKSGVKVPVYIFGQAVDTGIKKQPPYKLPGVDDNKFVLYSIFEWTERKNPRALLEAYWKEFKDNSDTVLVIKTNRGDYEREGINQINHEANVWKNNMGFSHYPRVVLITKLLDREEILRLHATGDVFVSTHRGEGWGLPQCDALLCGKPVISTKIGGVHEYLDSKYIRGLKFDLVPIDQEYNKYYEPGMLWAEVDQTHLREKMRAAYNTWSNTKTRGLLKAQAGKGRNYLISEFSYEKVGALMVDRLQNIERSL